MQVLFIWELILKYDADEDIKLNEQLSQYLSASSVFDDEKATEAKSAVIEKLNATLVKEFVKKVSQKRVSLFQSLYVQTSQLNNFIMYN